MERVARFNRFYFGDKVIRAIVVNPLVSKVTFEIDEVILLKDVPNPSIFDPESVIAPAAVVFADCQELLFSQDSYAMNATIVEHSASVLDDGKVSFRFALTGGHNNETFWREITIVATDFLIISKGP